MWKKKFQIESLSLGNGQYGEVKLAINLNTKQELCVKIIQKRKDYGINVLNTYQINEFEIAKTLIDFSHPNLVKIIDAYDEENEEQAYIFMELCENNLEYYLAQKKKISNTVIDELITQVAKGYAVLKENNIIHRDLKPANLLYKTENGECFFKIADFGLSKIFDPNNQNMTHGVGTPIYRAPENETNLYNDRCDIYSLGVIIFELLTGKMGKNSLFRFKEKEQLRQKCFSEIYKEELKNTEKPYQNLLNKMIVYEPAKRITWEELINWKQMKKALEQLDKDQVLQQPQKQQQQFSQFNNNQKQVQFNSNQLNQQQNIQELNSLQRQVPMSDCQIPQFYRSLSIPQFSNQQMPNSNFQPIIQKQPIIPNQSVQNVTIQPKIQQQQNQMQQMQNSYGQRNFQQQFQQQPTITNFSRQNVNAQSNINWQQQQAFNNQQMLNKSQPTEGVQNQNPRQSIFPAPQQKLSNPFSQQPQQKSFQQQQQQQGNFLQNNQKKNYQ